MKIGILASIGNTIDAFFPPLIKRWEEAGVDVFTAAGNNSAYVRHTVIESITRKPSIKNLRASADIHKWIDENSLDLVITNTATASFLARIRKLPVPIVYFCHGLHWNNQKDKSNWIWQKLESMVLPNTASVITINDDDEAWFREKFNLKSVSRLPAGVGVPIENFKRTPLPKNDETIHLVWAGEFSDRKRPWIAVEVIENLILQGCKAELAMCGDGPKYKEVAELILKKGLQKNISLIGRTNNMEKYINQSHALLMTSTWEGLPRIGLEALAIGRPVFAFDVKGTRSLPNVLLAPELDVEELAKIIGTHAAENFSKVSFIDPSKLHTDYAADAILQVAKDTVKKSNS